MNESMPTHTTPKRRTTQEAPPSSSLVGTTDWQLTQPLAKGGTGHRHWALGTATGHWALGTGHWAPLRGTGHRYGALGAAAGHWAPPLGTGHRHWALGTATGHWALGSAGAHPSPSSVGTWRRGAPLCRPWRLAGGGPRPGRAPGGSGELGGPRPARAPGGSRELGGPGPGRAPGGSGELGGPRPGRAPGGSGELGGPRPGRAPGGSGELGGPRPIKVIGQQPAADEGGGAWAATLARPTRPCRAAAMSAVSPLSVRADPGPLATAPCACAPPPIHRSTQVTLARPSQSRCVGVSCTAIVCVWTGGGAGKAGGKAERQRVPQFSGSRQVVASPGAGGTSGGPSRGPAPRSGPRRQRTASAGAAATRLGAAAAGEAGRRRWSSPGPPPGSPPTSFAWGRSRSLGQVAAERGKQRQG